MRLKLTSKTPMDDPAEKGWRLLERGELTLGRSPDCGWPLADPGRLLSKVHCRIVKDGSGFVLRDESVNGVTVDGVELAEGQSVRLANGSSLRLGDFAFGVEITGQEEPDWSDPDPNLPLGDDDLTVTSIVADVSPGGRTATGQLPGRIGDEWIEAQGEREPERLAGQKGLRGLDPGWSGPPELTLVQPALPDDWDAVSEAATRSEHQVATTARIRVAAAPETPAEPQRPAPAATVGDEAEAMVAAFLAGARMPPALPLDPASFLRDMGRALRAAADRLAALEAANADFLTSQGVARDRPAGPFDPAALTARLEALAEDQRLIQEAARSLVDDFAQRFDPRAIEAKVDAKAAARSLVARIQNAPFRAERAYWNAYRDAYRSGDDAGGGLRGLFREALGGANPPRETDGFEELSSDQRGGAS